MSVIVFFQLENKNRTVPFFRFRLCSGVAGSLCRWNLAGNFAFFVRGTLRQSFAELSLTYFKRCWYPNGVSSYGSVSAFLLFNRSKCTDFGVRVQTKKNMGIFFIAFFGFAFWGYARLIYKFFRDFTKVHRFFFIAFFNQKNLIFFPYGSQLFLSHTLCSLFFLSLLVIRILKFIAFLSSLAMIKCPGEIRKYLWKINVAVTVAVKAVLELPLYGCDLNCQSKKKCAEQVKKRSVGHKLSFTNF